MAEIVKQNPGSSEIQSPLMAGFSDALNIISKELNLAKREAVDQPLNAVAIDSQSQNKNRIFEAPFGKKLWLEFPTPVIKKNGVVVQKSENSYSIDYIGGSVTFAKSQDADKITASYSYIYGESTTIRTIQSALSAVQNKVGQYKGFFDSEKTLSAQVPKGADGDFAVVKSPNIAVFAWDSSKSKWVTTQSVEDLSKYITSEEAKRLIGQKENTIVGNSNARNYYGGDKKFHDLDSAIRETQLTGFSDASGEKVSSTDTVLQAIGKLQNQTANQKSWIEGEGKPTPKTVGKLGQRYLNTSTGHWYTCTRIYGSEYTWKDGSDAETLNGYSYTQFASSASLGPIQKDIGTLKTGLASAKETADNALPKSNASKFLRVVSFIDGVLVTEEGPA